MFSMFWLLCKTGKCFLIMVLILGSRGLYCVIKLHEVENLSLCVLGCLASSLEMFLISENCFLLYSGFLYDINSCCGNSTQTIITWLFDKYIELIM